LPAIAQIVTMVFMIRHAQLTTPAIAGAFGHACDGLER
jgi:hypothetical protein